MSTPAPTPTPGFKGYSNDQITQAFIEYKLLGGRHDRGSFKRYVVIAATRSLNRQPESVPVDEAMERLRRYTGVMVNIEEKMTDGPEM